MHPYRCDAAAALNARLCLCHCKSTIQTLLECCTAQNISAAQRMETGSARHVRERFQRVEKVRNMLRILGGGEMCSVGWYSEAIQMSLRDGFIRVNPGTALSDYRTNRFDVACSGLCYILTPLN